MKSTKKCTSLFNDAGRMRRVPMYIVFLFVFYFFYDFMQVFPTVTTVALYKGYTTSLTGVGHCLDGLYNYFPLCLSFLSSLLTTDFCLYCFVMSMQSYEWFFPICILVSFSSLFSLIPTFKSWRKKKTPNRKSFDMAFNSHDRNSARREVFYWLLFHDEYFTQIRSDKNRWGFLELVLLHVG